MFKHPAYCYSTSFERLIVSSHCYKPFPHKQLHAVSKWMHNAIHMLQIELGGKNRGIYQSWWNLRAASAKCNPSTTNCWHCSLLAERVKIESGDGLFMMTWQISIIGWEASVYISQWKRDFSHLHLRNQIATRQKLLIGICGSRNLQINDLRSTIDGYDLAYLNYTVRVRRQVDNTVPESHTCTKSTRKTRSKSHHRFAKFSVMKTFGKFHISSSARDLACIILPLTFPLNSGSTKSTHLPERK